MPHLNPFLSLCPRSLESDKSKSRDICLLRPIQYLQYVWRVGGWIPKTNTKRWDSAVVTDCIGSLIARSCRADQNHPVFLHMDTKYLIYALLMPRHPVFNGNEGQSSRPVCPLMGGLTVSSFVYLFFPSLFLPRLSWKAMAENKEILSVTGLFDISQSNNENSHWLELQREHETHPVSTFWWPQLSLQCIT